MENKIIKLTPEINTESGFTTIYLDRDFSFDNFFIVEEALRKIARFEIKWLFLSKLTAFAETFDNTFFINRKFNYKGSKLVLYYDAPLLYIEPIAQQNASKEDNQNVIDVSNLLIQKIISNK